MSNPSIGWLFYKDYFRGLDYSDLKSNSDVIKKKVKHILEQTPQIEAKPSFEGSYYDLTTTYPGLLIGSGNAHELSGVEGQAILGFHFDYTTGLPIIPGSSVKGVLRSAFKHPEYILSISGLKDEEEVGALEKEIFDNGDIFFDATVAKTTNGLLGDDYLTPHSDPFKDPIPLRFVKVMPGVTFRFDFSLSDGILTKNEKLELFVSILLDFGIGAKTNVGYGKFEKIPSEKIRSEIKRKEEAKNEALIEQQRLQEQAQKEEMLKNASPEVQLFESARGNDGKVDVVKLYQMLKANEVPNELMVPLAKLVKSEMQKSDGTWEKAKKKALERKEYIEGLLK